MAQRSGILRRVSFFSTACALLLLLRLVGLAQPTKPIQQPKTDAQPTVAEATQPIPLALCQTVNADAVMTVQKSRAGHYFASVQSNGTGYNLDGCPYYVVDVTLPGAFRFDAGSPLNSIKIYAGIWGPRLTEENCPAASVRLMIYKKDGERGSDFTKVKDIDNVKPWWVMDIGVSECHWANSPDTKVNGWPALKVDVPPKGDLRITSDSIFRVLVLPRIRGELKPAFVGWTWGW